MGMVNSYMLDRHVSYLERSVCCVCVYTAFQNGQVNTVGLTQWSVQRKSRDKVDVPGHRGQHSF